jgi:dTDP-4-amino-4,6-dideoxygalactose transaminase
MKIPFNKPYMTGKELTYIAEAYLNGMLAGDGPFTKKCHQWLEDKTGSAKALLTHSCTAALEMAAILADIQPGDEVIMPSYTFVSTANAFVLRGGVPVFVDIRQDTLNIDETKIEGAITPKTKAIVPVHYAGIGCEMDIIMDIAKRHNLLVIEDAAQGILSTYKGRSLGSIGHMGVYSFHETKNLTCGEGGALLINDKKFIARAEIVREKGTDRSRFFRGEIDKYTWQDIGSSYHLGEMRAAFLWAQLENADSIIKSRIEIWQKYYMLLTPLKKAGKLNLPFEPKECKHNGHLFYILLANQNNRAELIDNLHEDSINTVFHYVPLHNSPMGIPHSKILGTMERTQALSESLLRLPIWVGLDNTNIKKIVNSIKRNLN